MPHKIENASISPKRVSAAFTATQQARPAKMTFKQLKMKNTARATNNQPTTQGVHDGAATGTVEFRDNTAAAAPMTGVSFASSAPGNVLSETQMDIDQT